MDDKVTCTRSHRFREAGIRTQQSDQSLSISLLNAIAPVTKNNGKEQLKI